MDLANLSSNWRKLQSSLASRESKTQPAHNLKRKHASPEEARKDALNHKKRRISKVDRAIARKNAQPPPMDTPIDQIPRNTASVNAGLSKDVEVGKYVSLDCEMVGVGPSGVHSALARVSIVNYNGEQVYDSFVKPKEVVTDWRTHVSGIRPGHMEIARSFEEVQSAVADILKDRIVVGHSLRRDFKTLLLDHPLRDIRDTSHHAPYRKLTGGTPKLQLLASQLLGLEIQTGEHSSLEDARACMLLFRRDKDAFESKSRPRKRPR